MRLSNPRSAFRIRVHGAAGSSPRTRALLRLMLPLALFSSAIGWLLGALWSPPALTQELNGLLLLLLAAGGAIWLVRSQTRLENYLKGAQGEQKIAAELAGLAGNPDVFHGLPLLGKRSLWAADCDHIVVGSSGIFVIETKNWNAIVSVENGQVYYDGLLPDRPPLDQVKQAAAGLREELREALDLAVTVRPVLCFASGVLPQAMFREQGVILCRASAIRQVLQTPDEPLDSGTRARIVDYLRRISDSF